MELKNIKLAFSCFSNGGAAILKEITPDHPYRDGKRVLEEIVGRKVTVVLPANGYDTLTVKVADPTDALSPLLGKATPDSPVHVAFDGFTASLYSMRGNDGQWRTGVSAKAEKVRVVQNPSDDLDFGPEIE